jgi:hypothetical protein
MKAKLWLLVALVGGFAAAQNAVLGCTKEPSAERGAAPAPKIRFKGKTGAPGRNTVTATRGDNLADLRIITLAPGEKTLKPGEEPVTAKPHPRLWWHQSESTASGELQFVLSRIDGPKPGIVFKSGIPAMEQGFNVVDLTSGRFKAAKVSLEDGATYQWTILSAKSPGSPQAFCRMKVDAATNGEGLEALAESGNWYELFDAAATAAKDASGAEAAPMAELRGELIRQIGLDKLISTPAKGEP